MTEIEITQADRHLALWLIGVLDVAVPTVTFEEILGQISKHRHEARKAGMLEAAGIAERPFQPIDIGGCLMMDINQTECIAAAIRSAVGEKE